MNSKSRVLSKTRKLTIPRAELLTALLMAEQSSIIFQALQSVYNINDCYYWMDSAVVYAWILSKTKKYDAYTDGPGFLGLTEKSWPICILATILRIFREATLLIYI